MLPNIEIVLVFIFCIAFANQLIAMNIHWGFKARFLGAILASSGLIWLLVGFLGRFFFHSNSWFEVSTTCIAAVLVLIVSYLWQKKLHK
jgi:hypothetical protein